MKYYVHKIKNDFFFINNIFIKQSMYNIYNKLMGTVEGVLCEGVTNWWYFGISCDTNCA